MSHRLDPFGAIMLGLAKRLGLESRLVELRLQHHWDHLMGDPIASHTWPDQIRFKKLHLIVRNSVWLQQLVFLKPALLAKLQADMGPSVITEIVFRVGDIPTRGASPSSAPQGSGPAVSAERLSEAVAHASALKDPTLRQRFTEVISTYPSPPPAPPAAGQSRVP